MCGVVGYIDFTKSNRNININKMLDIIEHRGPDSKAFNRFETAEADIVLGHVRLSIIDLTHGADQPMSDISKKYHIVYNGEVYNFKEIRESLEPKYTFKTNSDTEVILYAYVEWGTEAIQKFIGMFSIVILDLVLKKIIFINDRLGVKPLYIYKNEDLLIFCSELKGILQYDKFNKIINKQALAQFMQYGYVQPPLSIFENVTKIEPGSIITLDLISKKQIMTKYWEIEKLITKPEKVNISKIEMIIQKACEYRMISDVPVSLFLSSGIDSSLVASILSKNHPINTVTIGVDDERYNEAEFAKNISKHLKTSHTEHYITSADILQLIEKLPFYYDEPFSDTSIYPSYLVNKITGEKYKVALSSDGGDEAFGGYYRYIYFKKYYSLMSKTPFILKVLLSKIINIFARLGIFNLLNLQMISLKLKKIKNSLEAKDISEFYESLNTYVSKNRLEKILINPNFDNGYYKKFDEINQKYNNDILNTAMALDYKTYLYQILTKIDRASMANSIEVREPLLDHNIIVMALNIQSSEKIKKGETKSILRKILSQYLDLGLLTKNKKGFSIPIEQWLKDDLKNVVNRFTSEQSIYKSGVFNYKEVLNIKEKFYAGKDDYIELWHILTFQLWYNKWVEKLND